MAKPLTTSAPVADAAVTVLVTTELYGTGERAVQYPRFDGRAFNKADALRWIAKAPKATRVGNSDTWERTVTIRFTGEGAASLTALLEEIRRTLQPERTPSGTRPEVAPPEPVAN